MTTIRIGIYTNTIGIVWRDMELTQTTLFDLKEAKASLSFNAPQTIKIASNAFVKGLMIEEPTSDPKASLEATLKHIFPERQEENKLQQARRILGGIARDIPDEELEVHITEFQYLICCWMDSFEKRTFDNKTLKQLLREG